MTNSIPWTATGVDFDELGWAADLDKNADPETDPGIPDILMTMFAAQLRQMKEYNDKIYADRALGEFAPGNPVPPTELWGAIDSPTTQASLRENAGYVVEELYEAINLLKNKPWKQKRHMTNQAHFREELADVWHFFIQLHIVAGLSPVDIFAEYVTKARENEERRNNGY